MGGVCRVVQEVSSGMKEGKEIRTPASIDRGTGSVRFDDLPVAV